MKIEKYYILLLGKSKWVYISLFFTKEIISHLLISTVYRFYTGRVIGYVAEGWVVNILIRGEKENKVRLMGGSPISKYYF